jgi:hypothetical protein
VLDARYDSLAQRREDVFFVEYSGDRRAAEVLREPDSASGNLRAGEATGDPLMQRVP